MFYNKNGVQVDKARYVVAGETFPINSIASVRAYTVKTGNIARLLLGIILTLIGFSMIVGSEAGFGLILVIIGIVIAYVNKPGELYSVRTSTSAGEADSYTSADKKEISDIVNAINEAIIARG